MTDNNIPAPDNLDALREQVEDGTLWAWDDTAEVFSNQFDSEGDLQAQLREYVADAADRFDGAPAVYAEYGSVRDNSDVSMADRKLVERHADHQQPKECYYNCQTAIIGVTDDAIRYVEGYRVSPKAPGPAPHAWLEVGGTVVEITIPEGMREAGAVYFGVGYDAQTVKEAMLTREQCDPLAEAPDAYPPLPATND